MTTDQAFAINDAQCADNRIREAQIAYEFALREYEKHAAYRDPRYDVARSEFETAKSDLLRAQHERLMSDRALAVALPD